MNKAIKKNFLRCLKTIDRMLVGVTFMRILRIVNWELVSDRNYSC